MLTRTNCEYLSAVLTYVAHLHSQSTYRPISLSDGAYNILVLYLLLTAANFPCCTFRSVTSSPIKTCTWSIHQTVLHSVYVQLHLKGRIDRDTAIKMFHLSLCGLCLFILLNDIDFCLCPVISTFMLLSLVV